MTTTPVRPEVELRFHPTDLDAETIRTALVRPLGSPSEAIEAAMMSARLMVIAGARAEVAKITGEMSAAKLIGAADIAWQIYAPTFVKTLGPVFAEQYLKTMRAAGAGDIPMATVYALAEQHASRVGGYYHESSRDALAQGFNTFVNRRMTERVAADRVLDGYGLTARGMAGYTSRALDSAQTVTPMNLKQRVLDYIGTSVRRRSKLFATQEEHNISQQAQQIAWMWLQDKGKISPNSQKIWLTARDERTCPQCAPMHGVKVGLNDRFRLPNGTEIWVPGTHPNCRCELRLLSHPWMADEVGKAWNPTEHPRGGDPLNPGRFSSKARSSRPVAEREPEDLTALQEFLDRAAPLEEPEPVKTFIDQTPKTRIEVTPKTFIDQTPKTVIGEKTQIGEPAKRTVLQEQTRTLVGGTPAERTMITGSPAARARIEADTARTFLAVEEEVRREPEMPKPTPYEVIPTLRLERPVYTSAIDPWEIDWRPDGDGFIELTSDTEFQPMNEVEATRRAQSDFDENGWAVVDDIIDGERNLITQELDDGTTLVGVVDPDHIADVVMYAAWQGRVEDSDQQGDAQIPVSWYKADQYGQPDGDLVYSSNERAAGIAEEWGMEASHFEVPVFVLDEGHNSELGDTVMLNAETRHGYESWITSGRYRIEPMNRQVVGSSVPVQFYRLVPEATPTKHTPSGFGQYPPDLPE